MGLAAQLELEMQCGLVDIWVWRLKLAGAGPRPAAAAPAAGATCCCGRAGGIPTGRGLDAWGGGGVLVQKALLGVGRVCDHGLQRCSSITKDKTPGYSALDPSVEVGAESAQSNPGSREAFCLVLLNIRMISVWRERTFHL